jgi:hypothetical protein
MAYPITDLPYVTHAAKVRALPSPANRQAPDTLLFAFIGQVRMMAHYHLHCWW